MICRFRRFRYWQYSIYVQCRLGCHHHMRADCGSLYMPTNLKNKLEVWQSWLIVNSFLYVFLILKGSDWMLAVWCSRIFIHNMPYIEEDCSCFSNFSCYNITYRVSRNVVAFFVLCISRLPMYLGSKCWTFSWSPFNSDFKTVLILILSIKIDQFSTLRRKKTVIKKQHFSIQKNTYLAYVIQS